MSLYQVQDKVIDIFFKTQRFEKQNYIRVLRASSVLENGTLMIEEMMESQGAHTPPRLKASCLYPTTRLPLVRPVRQKSCIETYRLCNCHLHSSVYFLRLREMQVSVTLGGASLVPVIQNMKTGKDGTECRHRLSEKNKMHTVLDQYSFNLRRHLWNTILDIT